MKVFFGFSVAIKPFPIFQPPQSYLIVLHAIAFLEESLLIGDYLILIQIDHLNFRLKMIDDACMLGKDLLNSLILLIFLLLGKHEGTEFLKLCFEVGCILLFLKIA